MRSNTEDKLTSGDGEDTDEDNGARDGTTNNDEVGRATSKVADESGVAADSKSTDNSGVADDTPRKSSAMRGRRVSVSVRTLSVGALILVLIAAVGVMSWLYIGAKATIDNQTRRAENNKHAEQIALDYAVNAAVMDYKDLAPWKQELVKGTAPELKDKLTKAATGMEQILLPLQWSSTANPLTAKVRSEQNGVYVVDSFVSVMTKTVQAGENLQSTATYSITIDSNNAWLITDVGGIAAMVGDK